MKIISILTIVSKFIYACLRFRLQFHNSNNYSQQNRLAKVQRREIKADCIDYKDYLDAARIEKYNDLFARYDTTGDGCIDANELYELFRSLHVTMEKEAIQEVITEVDKDGNGEIDFEEFCCMLVKITGAQKQIKMREYLAQDQIEEYRRSFQKFDQDGSGSIGIAELELLFSRLNIRLTRKQLEVLLTKFDTDGSGAIEFDEFCSMMVRLKKMDRKRKIDPTTHDASVLRMEGFGVKELKSYGFMPAELREAGFSARNIAMCNFKTITMRMAGFDARALQRAGLSCYELKLAGWKKKENLTPKNIFWHQFRPKIALKC